MSAEWSLDFCLVCDRQTLGSPYCSQSCRLAELSSDNPTLAHSASSSETTPSSETPDSLRQLLSASSSQTSLSSLKSHPSDPSMLSNHLQDELRDYASSFDQVRDLKRRMTS